MSKRIRVGGRVIEMDPTAISLTESEAMKPYMQVYRAQTEADLTVAIEAVAALPLEKRYLLRVVSALKWAFADFDSATVDLDRDTLAEADLAKIAQEVEPRSIQFCILLRALVGDDQMERMMLAAIRAGRTNSARRLPIERE